MRIAKLILVVLLTLTISLVLAHAAYAASAGTGGGGKPDGGGGKPAPPPPALNQSSGAIMNANRTETYSTTGATYWDNSLKKFVVSPDYYHYWSDEVWTEQERTKGNSVSIDGFSLQWTSYGQYMNASLIRGDSVNYLWGDPHWNVNGKHTYEIPQKTSYWFDMNNYSVRFVCNYMSWNLSVITEIEVYCPGNVRYRIDLKNNIVKYQA